MTLITLTVLTVVTLFMGGFALCLAYFLAEERAARIRSKRRPLSLPPPQ